MTKALHRHHHTPIEPACRPPACAVRPLASTGRPDPLSVAGLPHFVIVLMIMMLAIVAIFVGSAAFG